MKAPLATVLGISLLSVNVLAEDTPIKSVYGECKNYQLTDVSKNEPKVIQLCREITAEEQRAAQEWEQERRFSSRFRGRSSH